MNPSRSTPERPERACRRVAWPGIFDSHGRGCAELPGQGIAWVAVASVLMLPVAGAALATPSCDAASASTYARMINGQRHVYDFDGVRPFVNPSTGQADIHFMDFNGTGLASEKVTEAGSGTEHVTKVRDPMHGELVTRIQVFPDDGQVYGYRTQLNGPPIEPYKLYLYELEFKLDRNWQFDMRPGNGVLWQLKGNAKAYQYGHPVLSLELIGNRLRFTVLYPRGAGAARSWPAMVRWDRNDYVRVALPERPIVANTYYRVQLRFFADDRPARFGGKGFVQASLNCRPWFRHAGPTLHPDQNGPHRIDVGWYQWEGRPSAPRTVYLRTAHLYELGDGRAGHARPPGTNTVPAQSARSEVEVGSHGKRDRAVGQIECANKDQLLGCEDQHGR